MQFVVLGAGGAADRNLGERFRALEEAVGAVLSVPGGRPRQRRDILNAKQTVGRSRTGRGLEGGIPETEQLAETPEPGRTWCAAKGSEHRDWAQSRRAQVARDVVGQGQALGIVSLHWDANERFYKEERSDLICVVERPLLLLGSRSQSAVRGPVRTLCGGPGARWCGPRRRAQESRRGGGRSHSSGSLWSEPQFNAVS